MSGDVRIRRLERNDVDAYIALRREMLADTPVAFLGALGDDDCLDADVMEERLGHPEDAIFGAEDGDGFLVAAAGIYRERAAKVRHRATVWGVYTTPRARGRGISLRILEAVIDHADGLAGLEVLQLAVSADTPNAQRLYERLGFAAWGREPEAIMLEDRRVDEIHMWRPLRS